MKRIKPKTFLMLLKEAAIKWLSDGVFGMSASLSFFTIFSLAPLLIIVLFVVGLFWADQTGNAQTRILAQVSELTGPQGAEMVKFMLENAERPGTGGLLATLLGLGALLFGATAVLVQLKDALNTIWEIKPAGMGVKSFLMTRVLSFGLILGVGFLLLVSLIISAGLAAADEFITGLAPGLHLLMRLLNTLVAFGIITVLFAMIYRYLPDVDIAWRDVWVAAALTALLFNLGKFAISMYLGNSSVTSSYGAAGSLAVLLLWVYYSALIVLFGAELSRAYVNHFGKHAAPAHRAAATPVPEGSSALLQPGYESVSTTGPAVPVRKPVLRQAGLLLAGLILGRFLGRRSRA